METNEIKGLNEYQDKAMETCTAESKSVLYMLSGLSEEVGELNGKFAKAVRKGLLRANSYNNYIPAPGYEGKLDDLRNEIKKEAGDVAWMLAGFCKVMGWTLSEVCQLNIDKLADRKKRGVIVGKGDNR